MLRPPPPERSLPLRGWGYYFNSHAADFDAKRFADPLSKGLRDIAQARGPGRADHAQSEPSVADTGTGDRFGKVRWKSGADMR
jgi:hypothetical protein